MKIDFTAEQVELIRSQVAPKATNDELKLFLYQAQRTGLDPLTRQIYCIHRWNAQQKREAMTIQTSIDGFRVIAERSGDYGGQSEPTFVEQDGRLISCKITVFRFRGETRYEAAVGVAYWSEYVQLNKDGNPMGLWGKMPHTMLAKVAEALALRKAYPQDLSGLYTGDEMQQADTVDVTHEVVDTQKADNLVNAQLKDIEEIYTLQDLKQYYNDNKARIDADIKIKKAVSVRKQQILSQMEHEAR